MEKILIIGAGGQLGTELTEALRVKFGSEKVIASDIRKAELGDGPFEVLDAMKADDLHALINKHGITQIYHLAAILSAKGEDNPQLAWKLNMDSLMNVLEAARNSTVNKIFWPSSIAVFGPSTPKKNTPQNTIKDPSTVYGISKLAGEQWCEYYFKKYGVDVRSIRYPGLISYKALPGGGTTDYAIDIFIKALSEGTYCSYISENTCLPMMYMDDAVRATIELMSAPAEKLTVRSSYNLAAMSFSPKDLFQEIKKHIPDFSISYEPDFRQDIANSWSDSVDDTKAREDWHWEPEFSIENLTVAMLDGMKKLPKYQAV